MVRDRNRSFAIMLPTNNPNQGRWVHYRTHSFYPGTQAYADGDRLASRLRTGGYRMTPKELKHRIRHALGIKAHQVARR